MNKTQYIVGAILAMGMAVAVPGHGGSVAFAKGGKTPPVTLPASWPASVPVPPGALQQSIVQPSRWILALVAAGDYPTVMKSIRTLYLKHGFTASGPDSYVFSNGSFQVVVAGAARDHSAAQTNIFVYVSKITGA